jgi:quercetin dioxygenase-like cupin family protein
MAIIHLDDIPLLTTPFGVRVRPVYETPHVRIMNIILEPGQSIPEHSAPVDAFFYVISGHGHITVSGLPHEVHATDIVPVPAQAPMSLRAVDEHLVVLNIKTPRPPA